jgi:HK97 family phage portal protein
MFAAVRNWITKAEGRAEGGRITGPLAPVSFPDQGYIPMSWPLNWWQCGYNILNGQSCSIVDACISAYVRAAAQLPGYHRIEKSDGGVQNVTTSALSRVLRYPNTYQTDSDFLTNGIRSLLYDGNWYSVALRNQRQEVAELHWLNPKSVKVYELKVEGQEVAEIFYAIGTDGGNTLLSVRDLLASNVPVIPARDVLHVKLGMARNQGDPLIGESPLAALAFDLANRGAMSASMAQFFQNSSRPSGVLQSDKEYTQSQTEELRRRWIEQTTGPQAGGTPILSHGIKWQQTGISNLDSQAVEALKLSDKQVCAAFGVPGVLVGIDDGKTFATTEALMNYWLSSGLGYYLNHVERQLDQFFGLPGPAGGEWTEYDVEALLRTELVTRIDAYVRGVQGGIFSPNEARAKEGYPAVEAGDEPRVQQQVVPLSFALEPPTPPMPPKLPSETPAKPSFPADSVEGKEAGEIDEIDGNLVALVARAGVLKSYEQARARAT